MSYHVPNTTIICEQCGKEFSYYKVASVKMRHFCSCECHGISIRRGWSKKACAICGNEYISKNSDKKYCRRTACSIGCAIKLARLENKEKINEKLFWNEARKSFLVENYALLGKKLCAEKLGCSEKAIGAQVHRLGLSLPLDIAQKNRADALREHRRVNGHPMKNPEIARRGRETWLKNVGEVGQEAERQRLIKMSREIRLKKSSKLQESVRDKLLTIGLDFEYEFILNGNFIVDFAFPSKKFIVQIDGCYWHGHSCRNKELTSGQISQIKRDASQDKYCEVCGWMVLRIFECEIHRDWTSCLDKIFSCLGKPAPTPTLALKIPRNAL